MEAVAIYLSEGIIMNDVLSPKLPNKGGNIGGYHKGYSGGY